MIRKSFLALLGLGLVGVLALLRLPEAEPLRVAVGITPPAGTLQRLDIAPFAQVLLIPAPPVQRIRVDLVYPTGARHATGPEGIAHFVEHLAFFNAMGPARDRPKGQGAFAWTSLDATGYLVSGQSDALGDLISRLARTALPLETITTEFAKEERGIVLRERAADGISSAARVAQAELAAALHDAGPRSRSVIGTPDSIAALTLDGAKELHARTHRLSAATLLVTGPFNARELERVIDALALDSQPPTAKAPTQALSLTPVRDIAWTEPGDQARVVLARRIAKPPCPNAQSCAVLWDLVAEMLTSGDPGGLRGPLWYDAFLASDIQVSLSDAAGGQKVFEVTVAVDGSADPRAALEVLSPALSQSLTNGMNPDLANRNLMRMRQSLSAVRDPYAWTHATVASALVDGRAPFDLSDKRRAAQDLTLEQINAYMAALAAPGVEIIRLTPHPTGDSP